MKKIIYLCLFTFTFSCGPGTESDSTTKGEAISETESAALQKQVAELKAYVDELQQLANHIQVQGRALTPEEISFTQAIDQVMEAYASWNTKWEGKTITTDNRQEWETDYNELVQKTGELEELREVMDN